MTFDPLDELRAVNPVDDDRLPSASLARIRARVSEDAMSNGPRRNVVRRPLSAAVGLGAVVALVLVLFVGGRGQTPSVAPGPSLGTGSAMCVEPYAGPASVAKRTLAFDGTVTALAGDRVTFTVNQAYRGAAGPTITLEAPGMTGAAITSAGGPNLTVGERYLVAGDGLFVWACGYTQPYTADLASEWAAAVGG